MACPLLRKHALLWTVLLASLPLLGWWTYGLFDLDEGFYAAVTAEMNRRGEWITPFYNGHPWFEKPILLYWFAKPCLMVFGNMIGPRLPSVMATIGTYALVGWFAKRRLGETAAVFSVLVLSSCLLVVGVGRMMLTDPLLLMSVTAAFLTFWESLVGDKRWRLVTAVCLGLGVLAKGPISVISFIPPVAWTFWRVPTMRERYKGQWLVGTVLLFLVVALWYVPAYLQDGQMFVQQFLIEQNIGRFSGGDKAHTLHGIGNLFVYVPVFLLGLAPWSFYFKAWKRPVSDDGLMVLLGAWALWVLIFFTITSAKLPHYLLPMAPPVALLVGSFLARKAEDRLSFRMLLFPVGWLLFITVLAQAAFNAYYYVDRIGTFATPGFSEVHGLARYVKQHAFPTDVVAEYKMGRQQADMGTGKLKIQETSMPSTLLYMDRDMIDTDKWPLVLSQTQPVWILTRDGRIGTAELAAAGDRLQPVDTATTQEKYRLYLLMPRH